MCPCFLPFICYTYNRKGKENMSYLNETETEERNRKAKAFLAVKFGTIEAGTVRFWEALGDAEEFNELRKA